MLKSSDIRFNFITSSLSAFLVCTFMVLVVVLVAFSMPSIKAFGISFLYSSDWDPVNNSFGVCTALLGSLITAIIALMIAVPLSIGIAFLINMYLPKAIGSFFSRVIELMAGIPSIVYGVWGLFVLLPYMQSVQSYLYPLYTDVNTFFDANIVSYPLLAYVKPVVLFFIKSLPTGSCLLAASLILSAMIVPIITSMIRDLLETVPNLIKESALGLGATKYEAIKYIILPYIRKGIIGSVILGFGRAFGETMAVTFVIGNSHTLTGLFMPATTISSTIANEFNEATGTIYPSALIESTLALILISFIVFVISRKVTRVRK